MDWRIFSTAFATVLLAELADKTEIAILSLSAKAESAWPVFWGAMCAFFIATLLAVLLGSVFSRFVPENVLRIVSAGIFILIGVLTLWGKL